MLLAANALIGALMAVLHLDDPHAVEHPKYLLIMFSEVPLHREHVSSMAQGTLQHELTLHNDATAPVVLIIAFYLGAVLKAPVRHQLS